jgi:DNA mismatch repair protein MutS
MKNKKTKTTPLMEQYLKIKAEYKDVLLLYRMGDFYETFYEDAKKLSKTIGIALTKRSHGKTAEVPLAGFPYHALDNYLPKLLKAGLRIAICEQVEDPKLAKGIVKREVVEIASPGATLSEKLLDSNSNNFLVSIFIQDNICGIAIADVSTGMFQLSEVDKSNLLDQLLRYQPKEVLIAEDQAPEIEKIVRNTVNAIFTKRDSWIFNRDYTYSILLEHFQTHSLKGFGCDDMNSGIIAAGAIIHYLQENYKTKLEHFVRLFTVNLSGFMNLDESTRRNLEISQSISYDKNGKTLLNVLDFTSTSMGARLLKQWLQQPLLDLEEINKRHRAVNELFGAKSVRNKLTERLKSMFDMERLLGKLVTGRANAKDALNLKQSLQLLAPIKEVIENSNLENIKTRFAQIDLLESLTDLLENAIVENPPFTIQEGGIIRDGYNEELDELRRIAEHGKDWLIEYQNSEREKTGISSLKINYNKVFGYYLEVTNVHKDKVPDYFIRKQTLVNAERYITPELKEWEEKILGAEDKINTIEYNIFQDIRTEISHYIAQIQMNSRLTAELDCLLSFAIAAYENNYVLPKMDNSAKIKIVDGRHPVVEKNLPPGEDFIANSVYLDNENEQIWIITGPNMAGKSTFLRQVGLIVLMAQVGSFVPAKRAELGVVDRIFTRVGASDNLSLGESTFLIEMNETANILNNATPKSLILLDEIGRGTSTFDGLSIAWAVTEYIHNTKTVHSKTLFATHYHELTELALLYPRIKNYNVAVEEWGDQVVFLRKIIPGGTDNSYGIYVAQMAGLPADLINRAREILSNLEANELSPNTKKPRLAKRQKNRSVDVNQLTLFPLKDDSLELKKKIKEVDINNMTPMEALKKLHDLKGMVK